jgi:cellulose synthase/poly-beta-1,6-N-acetylglucosamine synthase-like glycosyltransferase
MLIDIFMKSSKGGYLGKEMPGSISFISNNTLCLRRKMLDEVGLYDEDCQRSEDVDLCARIARSRWLMFLCRSMVVQHRARPSLQALLAQWWGYGKYVPYVFKKYNAGQWEVFLCRASKGEDGRSPAGQYNNLVYLEGMPGTVCIFISPFLVFHCFLLAYIANIICGASWIFTLPLGCACLFSLLWYLQPDLFEAAPANEVVSLAFVRYLVNVAFVASHLINGWRCGTLYVAQAISERGHRIDNLG